MLSGMVYVNKMMTAQGSTELIVTKLAKWDRHVSFLCGGTVVQLHICVSVQGAYLKKQMHFHFNSYKKGTHLWNSTVKLMN